MPGPWDSLAIGPVPDLSGVFNTLLSPDEEKQFRQWLEALSKSRGYDAGQDITDYDLRGAFKSGATADGRGHFTDEFKKPNHPTFSRESKYSTEKMPGGQWMSLGGGWGFQAAPANMRYRSPAELMDYFRSVEPGNQLWFPNELPLGVTGGQ